MRVYNYTSQKCKKGILKYDELGTINSISCRTYIVLEFLMFSEYETKMNE